MASGRAKPVDESAAAPEAPADGSALDLGIALSVYGQTPEGRFVEIQARPNGQCLAPPPGEFTEH